jgi:hypothetical protein
VQVRFHDEAPSCSRTISLPLPSHVLPKLPQDVAVELRIDNLTWRHEFLMDNPVSIEKADQH